MLRKNQVDHVKREQHILAQTRNPFVVKLYYSFQSTKDLFLVISDVFLLMVR